MEENSDKELFFRRSMATESGAKNTLSQREDGKYQIRIESYDPARNTMKAIWLVSRNERLLSDLLDKFDVSEGETTDRDLRGNLLSVQRELQELKEAMDRSDGTRTPIVDASTFTRSSNFNPFNSVSTYGSSRPNCWSSLGTCEEESEYASIPRPASAIACMDFGLAKKKKTPLLSQIPLYSRPSIRTDFSVATVDPYPEIRQRPSRIPRPPPKPQKKKKITSPHGKKAIQTRPKTSLSTVNRPYQKTRAPSRSTQTITSKENPVRRPATSMALTRSLGTKKVSFGNSVDEKKPMRSTKTVSLGGRQEKKVTSEKQPRSVRPASSIGIKSIPRSSSRLSSLGDRLTQSRSGRYSAMSGSGQYSVFSSSSGGGGSSYPAGSSPSSYAQMYLSSKDKNQTAGFKIDVSARKEKSVKSRLLNSKETKKELKPKKPTRPKSSIAKESEYHPPPQVLPFDSPPPIPRIESCPVKPLISGSEGTESARERSVSPLVRSIAIIDDMSERSTCSREAKKTLPRIRIGDHDNGEYSVKAYFLDDGLQDSDATKTQGSGIIPSSPVEVDSCIIQEKGSKIDTVLPSGEDAEAVANTDDNISQADLLSRPFLDSKQESSNTNKTELTSTPPVQISQDSDLHKTESEDGRTGKNTLIKDKKPESSDDDVISFDKDSKTLATVKMDKEQSVGSHDDFQMDMGFLDEFEDEVSGLLDSLMTQEFDVNFIPSLKPSSSKPKQDEVSPSVFHSHLAKDQERELSLKTTVNTPNTSENAMPSLETDITNNLEVKEQGVKSIDDDNQHNHNQNIDALINDAGSQVRNDNIVQKEQLQLKHESDHQLTTTSIFSVEKKTSIDIIRDDSLMNSTSSAASLGSSRSSEKRKDICLKKKPEVVNVESTLRRKSTGTHGTPKGQQMTVGSKQGPALRRSLSHTGLDTFLEQDRSQEPSLTGPVGRSVAFFSRSRRSV